MTLLPSQASSEDINYPLLTDERELSSPTYSHNGEKTDHLTYEGFEDTYHVEDDKRFYCNKCSESFSRKSGVKRHLLRKHGLDFQQRSRVCGECCQSFRSVDQFCSHLEYIHGVAMTNKMLMFESVSAFEVWKRRLEEEGNCSYQCKSRKKSGFSSTTCYYFCTGDNCKGEGALEVVEESGVVKGSSLECMNCTSSMKVKLFADSEQVEVTVCYTHYGH